MAISVSFPFSWAAQPGAWGPSLSGCWFSLPHLISNSSDPQLVWSPNCSIGSLRAPSAGYWLSLSHLVPNWLNFLGTELYNSSMPTFFLWASQIALIQPIHSQGYTLLFLNWIHLLFIQVHFLFWQPVWVVGQYTTLIDCFLMYDHQQLKKKSIKYKNFIWVLLSWKVSFHILLKKNVFSFWPSNFFFLFARSFINLSFTFFFFFLLAQRVECLLVVWETQVQPQVMSYQRLKKWYLRSPCLTLSNIRYVSRVK